MKSVLIAEDEAMLRHMLLLEFQERGIPVIGAADGNETIAALQSAELPSLLLLDLLMPRKNGYEVLAYMREHDIRVPVVVLSNISSQEDERRAREGGAVDFVVKSQLDIDEVWLLANKYLGVA